MSMGGRRAHVNPPGGTRMARAREGAKGLSHNQAEDNSPLLREGPLTNVAFTDQLRTIAYEVVPPFPSRRPSTNSVHAKEPWKAAVLVQTPLRNRLVLNRVRLLSQKMVVFGIGVECQKRRDTVGELTQPAFLRRK
jgi:hypothetical protein